MLAKLFRKKLKNGLIHRIRRRTTVGIVLLGAGFLLGIHRHALAAKLRNEPLPPSPHRWCGS